MVEMQLKLKGQTVSRVCFDYGLVIQMSSDCELRIETTANFREAGQPSIRFAPETPGAVAMQLVQLMRREVSRAEVSSSGTLSLIFSDETELVVPPDSDYEAWQLIGPDWRVVCMPGGELATWSGQEK